MNKSKVKLLLNAEAFGFGPTAAIAAFFPFLRENFFEIAFIGNSHVLDLQRNLPYNNIYDTADCSSEQMTKIISAYDVFFTALDFEMASLAKDAGLKVIIYDPLTWYWSILPSSIKQADLYIAQDFYSVNERLTKDRKSFPDKVELVSPIVSQPRPRISREHVVVNLGGLQNPYYPVKVLCDYANLFITAITESLPRSENIIFATSSAIAQALKHKDVKSFNRTEIYDIFARAKYAFMTPGLGNIYDAAKFDLPTIWLPPANDSQGQQLDLLKKYGRADAVIDWSDLGLFIDYKLDQSSVLENIKRAIYSTSNLAVERLVENAITSVEEKDHSATKKLLTEFGVGGAEQVAKLVCEFCK